MAHTHKLVDGVRVDLTAEEITALNAADEIENQRMADAKVIYDAQAYARTRAAAYEEVKEQLDQLYHDMTAGKLDATGEWHKAIKAVKDATPKP